MQRNSNKVSAVLLAVACALIVAGLCLMGGPSTTEAGFAEEIFSARRIRVAPAVCLVGWLLPVVALLWRRR